MKGDDFLRLQAVSHRRPELIFRERERAFRTKTENSGAVSLSDLGDWYGACLSGTRLCSRARMRSEKRLVRGSVTLCGRVGGPELSGVRAPAHTVAGSGSPYMIEFAAGLSDMDIACTEEMAGLGCVGGSEKYVSHICVSNSGGKFCSSW